MSLANLAQQTGANSITWTAIAPDPTADGDLHFVLGGYNPHGADLDTVNSGNFFVVNDSSLSTISTSFGPTSTGAGVSGATSAGAATPTTPTATSSSASSAVSLSMQQSTKLGLGLGLGLGLTLLAVITGFLCFVLLSRRRRDSTQGRSELHADDLPADYAKKDQGARDLPPQEVGERSPVYEVSTEQ
jgi:hypothetical protein